MRIPPTFSLALGGTALAACSSGNALLSSQQPPGEVNIDGTQVEWSSAITTFEDEDLWLGVMNDDEHLYVMIIADDEQHIRQIVGRGMTVWIDAEGGEARTFGVRFPAGLALEGGGASPREAQADPDLLASMFEASKSRVEILRGEDTVRIARAAATGIEVEASLDRDFIYELKIPLALAESAPYSPDIRVGDTIGLGITTPPFDRDAMRQRMAQAGGRRGGGMPPGGAGGMGGGGFPGGAGGMPGGMGGGRRGMGGMSLPEPIELWVQVVLSETEGQMRGSDASARGAASRESPRISAKEVHPGRI